MGDDGAASARRDVRVLDPAGEVFRWLYKIPGHLLERLVAGGKPSTWFGTCLDVIMHAVSQVH